MRKKWKDIDDHDGYQVSDHGDVRSYINNRHGPNRNMKPHPLIPVKNKNGYDTVQLGRGNRKLVSRLVAKAFIPNPDNLPIVRHLDDNPSNNHASNLAWGTQVDNMQDCVRHGRLVGDTRAAIDANKKPVVAKNLDTGKILNFSSSSNASRRLRIPAASISKVLCGKMRKSHGWTFEYKNKGERL